MQITLELKNAKIEKAYDEKGEIIGITLSLLVLDEDISNLPFEIKEHAERTRAQRGKE